MYRFDAAKRNTISRGPVVEANLDLLAEAVDGIQAFRTRLSRELLETASFEDIPATDAGGAGHEAGEDGWELVSPAAVSQDAGRCGQLVTVERAGPQFTCFTSTEVQILTQLVAVEREVKAVLLTRVSPVCLLC